MPGPDRTRNSSAVTVRLAGSTVAVGEGIAVGGRVAVGEGVAVVVEVAVGEGVAVAVGKVVAVGGLGVALPVSVALASAVCCWAMTAGVGFAVRTGRGR